MTSKEFDDQFDRGVFDAEYWEYVAEHFDAWSKEKIERIIESGDAYEDFKETKVTV